MHLAASIGTTQRFIQAFSWMLIHSLWQGLVLAVVTGLILMLTKKTRATVRYNLMLVQFILFLLACGVTFMGEWNKPGLPVAGHGLAYHKTGTYAVWFNINVTGIKTFAHLCMDYFTTNAQLIVLLWLVLFLFRAIRVMNDLLYIRRIKSRSVYQPSDEWKSKVNLFCQKLQLKKAVQLLESGLVKMPVVIGHLKPVILVPVGLLAGLPPGQIEAVLLHELAHIKRNDYVVNFLQTATETVFFFNPGLLWISALLRDERENCCDDIALEQTKNKREFVEALISFKEHSLYGGKLQVAFPGKKDHLLNRVKRILNNQNKTLAPAEKAFFMAGVIVLSVIITTAAIAGVHTAISKHHKPLPIAAGSVPVKQAAAAELMITETEHGPKRIAHLRPTRSARATLKSARPQLLLNRADSLGKLRDKLGADQAGLMSVYNKELALLEQAKAKNEHAAALNDQLRPAPQSNEQAARNEAQARLNKLQELKNREQAERNREQARLNQIQNERNQEQALRNQEQALRNQEQARFNEIQARKNRGQQ